ncbi:MAG TPA: hypothetical protein VKZ63_02775 [Kofleriaceae bacterium]|nr:hypothetical protein [Kofleriaceae bacterium]
MSRSATLVVALLALPSLGTVCARPPGPPEPDACDDPGASALTSLEIGPGREPGQPFIAWAEADTAVITTGPQGGDMLGVALRAAGNPPPACLQQRSRLSGDGVAIEEELAIRTYEEGDGSRTSHTLWLVFDDRVPKLGSEVELVTEAGGLSASTRLTIAPDRHRLVSLDPPEQTIAPGLYATFELVTAHEPVGQSMDVTITSSDPEVIDVGAPTLSVYETAELTATARTPGTADLIVTYRDQELRATVVVP